MAATNRELEDDVREGRFRSDLFYRLNVLPLRLPPLRERVADIPALVEFFLRRFSRSLGKEIRGVTPETLERLSAYPWPGNVRELQNLVERAVVLATGPFVTIGDGLTLQIEGRAGSEPAGSAVQAPRPDGFPSLAEAVRRHIEAALRRSAGVIEGPGGAAKMLGLHPSTLRSRMKKLGIPNPARKPAES